MLNILEVNETNKMISEENFDVRTITIGISLIDCIDSNVDILCHNIYNQITSVAKDLVKTANNIENKFGVPIVNKRVSVTPISLIGASCVKTIDDYVKIAKTLDEAAKTLGINFIGGFSAIVNKGMTKSDELLIRSIPSALSQTERVCSSVNVGSTKTGINMDAVRLVGEIIKEAAELTKDNDSLACAKFVVFTNAPDDNPFMAGAFHGVSEADTIINVGVIDLSLAPTPAIGDSIANCLEEMGLERVGAPGTTAALAILNDQVKKGGVMASSYVGGLSGAFIPVSEDEGMIQAVELGSLSLEKLEAMTCVCSVGLDMIAIPGKTSASTISGIIADEMAIGMINQKTTAVRIIPVVGKDVGDTVEFGGLLGYAPIMKVNEFDCSGFVSRKGRIPAPIHSFKN